MAFRLAEVLPLELEFKQQLLESSDPVARLEIERVFAKPVRGGIRQRAEPGGSIDHGHVRAQCIQNAFHRSRNGRAQGIIERQPQAARLFRAETSRCMCHDRGNAQTEMREAVVDLTHGFALAYLHAKTGETFLRKPVAVTSGKHHNPPQIPGEGRFSSSNSP